MNSNSEINRTDSEATARSVGLASMLSPIRAQLETASDLGWRLTVSPGSAHQAWRVATSYTRRSDAAAMLWTASDIRPDAGSAHRGLRQSALRRSVRPLADLSNDHGERIILTPEAANILVGSLINPAFHAVLVEGVIDERDADAMCDAAAREESPLTSEIRAAVHFHATRSGPLVVEARDRNVLLATMAEQLRSYAASRLTAVQRRLDSPPLAFIDRMFRRTGSVSIRPIETDVQPGTLDIGINTRVSTALEPADWSLVYDIYGDSWHDADEIRR